MSVSINSFKRRNPSSLSPSILVLLLVLAMACLPARALQCGDKITTDTKLDTNLGPCPDVGLYVGAVLDLNGHSITGTGNGTGIQMTDGSSVLKGPGVIANFALGILAGGNPSTKFIYDLTLLKNTQAITVFGRNRVTRIFRNIIVGKDQQNYGITAPVAGEVHIYQNTISGYSVGVYLSTEVAASIDENLITLNDTGIWAYYPDRMCYAIRGNRVTLNKSDGIRTGFLNYVSTSALALSSLTCEPGMTGAIEDNTVNLNGNGITINVRISSDQVISQNIVTSNRNNGISVNGTAGEQSTAKTQVIGNYASRNGVDLFWDGVSQNACWDQNVFDNASPLILPGC